MSWLSRLFRVHDGPPPPHVQAGIDVAEAAKVATAEAHDVADRYWAARGAPRRQEAIVEDYARADERLHGRR